MTSCEAMKIVNTGIPKSLKENFIVSDRSDRFILPKLNLMKIMKKVLSIIQHEPTF